MPQERKTEHKSLHHDSPSNDSLSWWQKFHFSGKVIMCSVLFGLGLVLIGGLLLAIGEDHHDDKNLSEIQNKAPMSIVGPIIMGIGGFTVFVGIIMCLFETNICRKRQPDSRPLIDEQNSDVASRNSDATSIPSTSQKREKHRHHKKSSSPRRHKGVKKSEQSSYHSSPSSMPIDVHRSMSRDLTSSDKFLTPPSSLVYEHQKLQPTCSDAENQTSASLLKSFTSSGKSWNTSTEFQTPSSSLQDSSGSFEDERNNLEISPEHKQLTNDRLKNLKHEFVTPQNSSAEIIDVKSNSSQGTAGADLHQIHNDDSGKNKESIKETSEKLDVNHHDFVTPMNSYVDQPNVAAPKWDISKENSTLIASNNEEEVNIKISSVEKSPASSLGYLVHKTDEKDQTKVREDVEEKHKDCVVGETSTVNNDSAPSDANDFESKDKSISHDLKESTETSDSTLTTENVSHVSENVLS